MRLWHKDLIQYLPVRLLRSQYRDVCIIFNDMLDNLPISEPIVNRVCDYDLYHFGVFVTVLQHAMEDKDMSVNYEMFSAIYKFALDKTELSELYKEDMFKDWHNDRYLKQCMYALEELYDCGEISKEEFDAIFLGVGIVL